MKRVVDVSTLGPWIKDVGALGGDTAFEVWAEGRRYSGLAEVTIERGKVMISFPSVIYQVNPTEPSPLMVVVPDGRLAQEDRVRTIKDFA